MASALHRGIVELLRRDPSLAPDLAARAGRMPPPPPGTRFEAHDGRLHAVSFVTAPREIQVATGWGNISIKIAKRKAARYLAQIDDLFGPEEPAAQQGTEGAAQPSGEAAPSEAAAPSAPASAN